MEKYIDYIIVCKPKLTRKESNRFYILESCYDGPEQEMTLIGNVGVTAHIVGIERTLSEAKKKYRQLLKLAETRLKLDIAA